MVGNKGKIYSIDTNKELLEFISNNAKQQEQNNIITILTAEDNIPSFEEKVDLIFMRNVYHHISNRVEYVKKMKSILKPDGKVAIIEYIKKGNLLGFHRRFGHYVVPEVIIKEMETAGYKVDKQYFFLPEQSFTIFSFLKEKKKLEITILYFFFSKI